MKTASPSSITNDKIWKSISDRIHDPDGFGKNATPSSATAAKLNKLKATFGTVIDATGSSMTIETQEKDQVKVITVKTTDMILFAKQRSQKAVKISDIKPGWFAIAMGSQTIPETLEAQRISFTDNYEIPLPRLTVVGKITEIDESTITLANGKTYAATFPDELTLRIKGINNPKIEDVTISDKAMAVIETSTELDKKTKEEKTVYTIRALYVVPSINNPKAITNQVNTESPNAEATASASPTPTPKTTTKPSPKATQKPSTTQ